MAQTCGGEAAFLAVKSSGERKQAYAEYQTQRAKREKTEKRRRSVAARAGFLSLLAETPEVTHRMRWNAADELLASACDERYAAVGDAAERRELFDDFVGELAKKARLEAETGRRSALEGFRACLADHCARHPAASHEDDEDAVVIAVLGDKGYGSVDGALRDDARFRGIQSEERRREFGAFVDAARKRVAARDADRRQGFYDAILVAMRAGLLPRDTPFRDLDDVLARFAAGGVAAMVIMSSTHNTRTVAAARELAREDGEEDDDEGGDDHDAEVVAAVRRAMADCAGATARLGSNLLGDTYARARDALHRETRADRRACRDLTRRANFRFSDASAFDAWLAAVAAAAGDEGGGDAGGSTGRRPRAHSDGRDARFSLADAVAKRKPMLAQIFVELRDRELGAARDEERRREKREARFRDLLHEYLYRLEHCDAAFGDFEPTLSRHSAFDGVDGETRRRLFDEHRRRLRSRHANDDQDRPRRTFSDRDGPPRSPAAADKIRDRWVGSRAVDDDERWRPQDGEVADYMDAAFVGPAPPPSAAKKPRRVL